MVDVYYLVLIAVLVAVLLYQHVKLTWVEDWKKDVIDELLKLSKAIDDAVDADA